MKPKNTTQQRDVETNSLASRKQQLLNLNYNKNNFRTQTQTDAPRVEEKNLEFLHTLKGIKAPTKILTRYFLFYSHQSLEFFLTVITKRII